MSDDLGTGRLSRYELQIARGVALDAYTDFEHILLEVYMHLSGGQHLGTAGITFFRLGNAGLRTKVLEELIGEKFNDRFDLFWFGDKKNDGLMTLIRQLDQTRNQIVHWKAVGLSSLEGFGLVPINIWRGKVGQGKLSVQDVYDFVSKCHCLRMYAGNFNWRTTRYQEGENSEKSRTWLDVFERPPSFPPGPDHPLFQLWTEQRNPRLSFRSNP